MQSWASPDANRGETESEPGGARNTSYTPMPFQAGSFHGLSRACWRVAPGTPSSTVHQVSSTSLPTAAGLQTPRKREGDRDRDHGARFPQRATSWHEKTPVPDTGFSSPSSPLES